MRKKLIWLLVVGLVAGCGGGSGGESSSASSPPPTYEIGGTVAGLMGTGLILQNNSGNDLAVAANGVFSFSTTVPSGAAYGVTIKSQPTVPTQACEIVNGSGTVSGASVSTIAVTCVTTTYSVGATVDGLNGTGLVLQNNAGDDLAVSTNGAVTFANRVASGGTYNVTVKTQPTAQPAQTCVAENANGTVSNAPITNVAVNCRNLVGKFLYIHNRGSDSITGYSINRETGALTSVPGSPLSTPHLPFSIRPNAAGTYMYVSAQGSGAGSTVSAFAIDGATGALTELIGSPYPAGAGSSGGNLVFSPDQRFLYMSNYADGTWYCYEVNSATGHLAAVAGFPISVGRYTQRAVFDSAGKYIYVPYGNGISVPGGLRVYSVDAISGAWTLSSSIPLSGSPHVIGHPSGRFMYIYDLWAKGLEAFTVNAITGALAPIAGGQYVFGSMPNPPVLHRSGKFIYATNRGGTMGSPAPGSISGFAVNDATGLLTTIAGSPWATAGNNASGPYRYPDGNFLAAVNAASASVSIFGVNTATGALTAVGGTPLAIPGTSPGGLAIDPSGKFAYLVDTVAETMSVFSVNDNTGLITYVSSYPTGTGPSGPIVIGLQ